jgi:hypothetical protein
MINSLIEIGLGYVFWRYLPGKITAASKKARTYIDLGLQIMGIILMITGAIQLVRSIYNLIVP